MTIISPNPIRETHVKYVLRYLRELMQTTLTPVEDQLVMLHCGMYTRGKPVNFAGLARVFRLGSPQAAQALYRQAVRKTRAAIPGSALENWIACYHLAYYPNRDPHFYLNPEIPVPDWDGLRYDGPG